MPNCWVVYGRSVLKQSAVLWQGGEQRKPGVKIILKGKGTDYELFLSQFNLTTLEKRKDILSLRWAKKCLSNRKQKNMITI